MHILRWLVKVFDYPPLVTSLSFVCDLVVDMAMMWLRITRSSEIWPYPYHGQNLGETT